MTEGELVAGVRRKCGKIVNVEEMETEDIVQESDDILNRIAEKVTVNARRYITSQANVREYDVPDAVLRVLRVLPWEMFASGSDPMNIGGSRPASSAAAASEKYNFPSMRAIEMSRRIRGLPNIRHYFDPITRKLAIDPEPEEDGVKYWYIAVEADKWTLAAVPPTFTELVKIGTSWKCLEFVALKRSELGGVIREGGFVSYPASELKKFIEAYQEQFEADLEIKSRLYVR